MKSYLSRRLSAALPCHCHQNLGAATFFIACIYIFICLSQSDKWNMSYEVWLQLTGKLIIYNIIYMLVNYAHVFLFVLNTVLLTHNTIIIVIIHDITPDSPEISSCWCVCVCVCMYVCVCVCVSRLYPCERWHSSAHTQIGREKEEEKKQDSHWYPKHCGVCLIKETHAHTHTHIHCTSSKKRVNP